MNAFLFKRLKLIKSDTFSQPQKFEFPIPANRRIPDFLQLHLERLLYKIAFKIYVSQNRLPDLIHAQSGMDAAIYANDIAKLTGLPFVIFEHQVFVFHYYSRQRAKLILEGFKNAYKTAAVSTEERRQVIMNQPECNPVIIPNLIDEAQFKVKSQNSDKTLRIVTFMYANTVKGYRTFFESMFHLQKFTEDFEFAVVGNAWAKGLNQFEKICNELGIIRKAKFIPRIQREEVSNFLQNFDLYVCSSDFESFGIAPREAMMVGLPVVSTANGGIEDCITLKTGILVPVRDAQALAEAICNVKNNYSLYEPNTIRKFVIDQCGCNVFENKMIEFYKND